MAATNGQNGVAELQISGRTAIVAPVSAFPNGVPSNALIVIPREPNDEMDALMKEGPVTMTLDQMWKLLGFNGPAIQVQDSQGRPTAIGLEDLLAGLDKGWVEQPDDLNRGRIYAQELIRHNRLPRAEQVLSKIVAKGGTGDDWLNLGVTQLLQGSEDPKKLDKAEGTLKGAQNLMKENPYPAIRLAQVFHEKKEQDKELEFVDKAIAISPGCIDAWVYLFQFLKQKDSEESALVELEKRADAQATAAPYIAIQGYYANDEATYEKAITYAEKGLAKAPDDPVAILCLSALHGQKGDFNAVIKILQPHEAKMSRDRALANNYFQALFQSRQIEKVTKLLNALAGSPNQDVKQFAIESSRMVAQYLQQQQQQLAANGGGGQQQRR
jgi:predicted Zn-dependent protease